MKSNNNNTKDTLLDIRNLVVEYHTDEGVIHAVNGVDLVVNHGETLGLVGETGAGKTTIARSILRILPTPPAKIQGGEIYYNGTDLLKLTEAKMRKVRGDKIAMIFQDPMTALNPIETVGFQIAEAVRQHNNVSRYDAEKKACDMLELVGIPMERYGEYPNQFSGGMKQRVVIAMALACSPELLLADEPTTALDVTIQAQVLEIIQDLKKKLGTSVVMITHDLGIIAEVCDMVAVIYAGEIVEYGTVVHIFKETGHPYTKGLFGSLPRLDLTEPRLKPIKGMMPDPSVVCKGCSFAERCPDARPECHEVKPAMGEIAPGHFVKCHLAGGV